MATVHTKEDKVTFENSIGEKLVGIQVDPGSDEVCILCHGLASGKNRFHFPAVAQLLAEMGLGSLRFDFSGNGESEGTFCVGNMLKEAEIDLRAAVLFIRSQGKRVRAILGHSKGGSAVVLYAAKYGDVPRIVNCSGRFDYGVVTLKERFGPDILERVKEGPVEFDYGFKWLLTKEDVEKRLATDISMAGRSIKEETSVLTIHGSADEVVDVQESRLFAACIRQHELHIIEGANHSFTAPSHKEDLLGTAVDFITRG